MGHGLVHSIERWNDHEAKRRRFPIKRVNNLYEKLISDDNLKMAIFEVNSTHRWLPHHRPNKTVAWVEEDISVRINDLKTIIESGFIPASIKKKRIWDKSAGKWRDISEPQLWPDQYIHHALIQVLEPVMMRGMDKFCCGSIRGRGIHYGMNAIKKWMKNNKKGTKYCLELDIHHFYDSLEPKIVVNRLLELVKDRRVIDLAERIMSNGVLIGVYCSQWFANITLQPLDHMIREGNFGVSHYLRYMDNFTIFSSNKRKLRKLMKAISQWLNEHGLMVKDNWQIFCTNDRLPSALGYRYGRGYTLLRKRNLLRLKRQLKRYYYKKARGQYISVKMAIGLISRIGQLKHCNSTQIYSKIYKRKTLKELKDIVRKYFRKERNQWNMSLA